MTVTDSLHMIHTSAASAISHHVAIDSKLSASASSDAVKLANLLMASIDGATATAVSSAEKGAAMDIAASALSQMNLTNDQWDATGIQDSKVEESTSDHMDADGDEKMIADTSASSATANAKSSDRPDLQVVLDMDETLLHFIPHTGTSMLQFALHDVPFYPAVGLRSPVVDASAAADRAALGLAGTTITAIYNSNQDTMQNLNNADAPYDVTILLEDAAFRPVEKRAIPSLGGVVMVRPHVDTFIANLLNDPNYNTTVRLWTAAPQAYADSALAALGWNQSPGLRAVRRFYQQHCARFLLERSLYAHRVTNEKSSTVNGNSGDGAASGSASSSFEVHDLSVGDSIFLKPLSALFALDGGRRWSPANTVLIDNAPYVGLQYGQKHILAPDFYAAAIHDRNLRAYWCTTLQHRQPYEAALMARALGVHSLTDAITSPRLHIKRVLPDTWMHGDSGYRRIMDQVERAMAQHNHKADLEYFGTITFGQAVDA